MALLASHRTTTCARLSAKWRRCPGPRLRPSWDSPCCFCPSCYRKRPFCIYHRAMAALPDPALYSEPVLRLLVELPSWPRVFFGNLRDTLFPRRLPQIDIRSAPAPFWHDVFVKRPLPWHGFFQSVVWHFTAFALLVGFTRFFALQPRAVPAPAPTFDHSQVIYYEASEYLPPAGHTDHRRSSASSARPGFSRQPIISVPPEADNRSQTIVTPPKLKIKHDVPLPNIVAWSDKPVKPQLAIPAAPVIPASEITRIAPPRIENAVVTPPPDAAHLTHRRDQPDLQSSVVAPPPSVETSTLRNQDAGELNIGHSAVIAPAPELAVTEQRAFAGGQRGCSLWPRVPDRSTASRDRRLGIVWLPRPRDCAEPPPGGRSSAGRACRQPSRRFRRHSRGTSRSFGSTRIILRRHSRWHRRRERNWIEPQR